MYNKSSRMDSAGRDLIAAKQGMTTQFPASFILINGLRVTERTEFSLIHPRHVFQWIHNATSLCCNPRMLRDVCFVSSKAIENIMAYYLLFDGDLISHSSSNDFRSSASIVVCFYIVVCLFWSSAYFCRLLR